MLLAGQLTLLFFFRVLGTPRREPPTASCLCFLLSPSALASALCSAAAALNVGQRRSHQMVPHSGTRRDGTRPLREREMRTVPVECRRTDDTSLHAKWSGTEQLRWRNRAGSLLKAWVTEAGDASPGLLICTVGDGLILPEVQWHLSSWRLLRVVFY